jgi:3-oxoacyl-[acyl-carrier protein] reductase
MGAEVILVARNKAKLKATAQRLQQQTGHKAYIEAVDLADNDCVEQMMYRHQDADILITNCGGPPIGSLATLALSDWDNAYQQMIRAVVIATKILVPAMANRQWGRVVMLTSSTVVDPLKYFSISNSLRKALLGLAQSIAQEYADAGITANLVCPGLTRTARMESLVKTTAERTNESEAQVLAKMLQPIPAQRMAEPKEIAAAVAFLCTPIAAYMQGQTLLVDGGQALR